MTEHLTIHRRTIGVTDRQSFTEPGYVHRLLSVAPVRQPNLAEVAIDVWFEVYPGSPSATRVDVSVVGTGNPIPENTPFHHIGTVVTPAGMVWHVYADTEYGTPQ